MQKDKLYLEKKEREEKAAEWLEGHKVDEYLYQKFQKEFESKELTELEKKKEKLKELREFYKPIDSTELQKHAKNYEKIKLDRSLQQSSQKPLIKQPKVFKSKMHSLLQEMEIEQKEWEMQEQQNVKLKVEKMISYAQLVKVVHKPKVSE